MKQSFQQKTKAIWHNYDPKPGLIMPTTLASTAAYAAVKPKPDLPPPAG
ncbi:hypothetical protein [Neisseria wadsworthii]|nr:hypothetical protein [Neisseria wadsworthii]